MAKRGDKFDLFFLYMKGAHFHFFYRLKGGSDRLSRGDPFFSRTETKISIKTKQIPGNKIGKKNRIKTKKTGKKQKKRKVKKFLFSFWLRPFRFIFQIPKAIARTQDVT